MDDYKKVIKDFLHFLRIDYHKFYQNKDFRKITENDYHKMILHGESGNNLISELLDVNSPLMVARIGSTELSCLKYYLSRRIKNKRPFNTKIKDNISNLSGFFPSNDEMLDRFCLEFLNHIKNVDIMAVWYNNYENTICQEFCNNAHLVELSCLESFRFQNPWSYQLRGKKVLVVHPFTESIKLSYTQNRARLFDVDSNLKWRMIP